MNDPNKQYDVIGFGAVAIDELIYVDRYPEANVKQPVLRREKHCGGLTHTALVAAARLGARCAYAGQLGHDDASALALQTMREEGIDAAHVAFEAGARPVLSTIVVGAQGGTRNIFPHHADRDGAHPDLPAAEVITSAKVVFVDHVGIDGQIRAAAIARANGLPVVADLENDISPRFGELLALIDHLIISQGFSQAITGCAEPADAVAQLMAGRNRSLVAVTCGEAGCWYASSDDPMPRHQPTFHVQVVDTTGCGDVFHGAYAAALANKQDPHMRVLFASAAAALKASRSGGGSSTPMRAELDSFLKTAGYPT